MSDKPIEALVESALRDFNSDQEILSGYDSATIDAVNQHSEEKIISHFIRELFEDILKNRINDAVRRIVSELFRAALVREENDILRSKLSVIKSAIDALEKQLSQAMTDELTGLPSRRIFNTQFISELSRLRRYDGELALLFCDIDHFKIINDTFGHEAGDEILKKVAQVFKRVFPRPTDHLCRYGGEELVACLVSCNPINAEKKAEELRKAIEQIESPFGKITISIGCTHVDNDRFNMMRDYPEWGYWFKKCAKDFSQEPNIVPDMTAAKLLLAEADGLVYKAKKNGRNRVETARDAKELSQLREVALQKRLGNGNGS